MKLNILKKKDKIETKVKTGKREKRISLICEKTGWSREKADKELRKAFKLGINNFNYMKYEGWKLSEGELKDLAKEIEVKKKENKDTREKRISIICKNTNWSREEADEELRKAFKLGINNFNYMKYECWKLNEEESKELAKEIEDKKKEKKDIREERISIICEKTGWSREEADKELSSAFKLGINNFNYMKYECWKLNEEESKELVKKIEEKKREKKDTREERISIICKNTNWSREKADEELKKAFKLGINNFYYIENEGWDLSEDELKELAKEIREINDKRKERISIICEKTGWSREKVDVELVKAFKLGLNSANYVKYEAWNLNKEQIIKVANMRRPNIQFVADYKGITFEEAKKEMDELNNKYDIAYKEYITNKLFLYTNEDDLNEEIKKIKNNHKWVLNNVCKDTGWSMEKVKRKADKLKQKYGTTYRQYAVQRFYDKTDEEIEEIMQQGANNMDSIIDIIMKKSGWSEEKVRKNVKKCDALYSIPPAYYVLYKVWELTDEELDSYARLDDINALNKKYNRSVENLSNKLRFNEVFKEYTGRKYWINRDTSFEEFQEFVDGLDEIFCKPLTSEGGMGSKKCEVTDDIRGLYDYFMSKNRILVEECIKQHPDIEEFKTGCVNTVRVVAIKDDDKNVDIIYTCMKFGNGDVADNLSHKGMVVAVDKETGVIITDAINKKGEVFDKHPISNKKFKGFKIPHWDKLIGTVKSAMLVEDGVRFVGWDVAVCEDKIILVEGNCRPDPMLIQAPYSPQKKGMRYLFEKYL